MTKFFNTTGLCFPDDHYMVDPLKRLKNVVGLINRKQYFTLHAPRQTGKTTYLYALARKLNAGTDYIALVVSFESAGYPGIAQDKANTILIDSIYSAAQRQLPESLCPENYKGKDFLNLKDYLQTWSPIYAEIIPRIMAYPIQATIPKEIHTEGFVGSDGKLNMEKLLKEFQKFYRRNSGAWLDRYEYKESAHHLLLMAFLQRIINSGGDIVREMAVGNGRLDMLVTFGKQEFAMELKIKHDKSTIEEGKDQLHRYLETRGCDCYFFLFMVYTDSWTMH
ncbi:MAG: hypothetical protein GY757_29470 [bacterium]|nr:hypothetical protein [bacterium]